MNLPGILVLQLQETATPAAVAQRFPLAIAQRFERDVAPERLIHITPVIFCQTALTFLTELMIANMLGNSTGRGEASSARSWDLAAPETPRESRKKASLALCEAP